MKNATPVLVISVIFALVMLAAYCSVQSDVDKCKAKNAEYVSTGQLEGICVRDGLIIP